MKVTYLTALANPSNQNEVKPFGTNQGVYIYDEETNKKIEFLITHVFLVILETREYKRDEIFEKLKRNAILLAEEIEEGKSVSVLFPFSENFIDLLFNENLFKTWKEHILEIKPI